MNEPWSVVIEGVPPSINSTYGIRMIRPFCPVCGRGTPSLKKNDGIETWQEAVAWAVKAARPSGWVPGRRVRLNISWFMPRLGRDADNGIKALMDGVKVGLGVDDTSFLPSVLSNEVDRVAPRTVVTIVNET